MTLYFNLRTYRLLCVLLALLVFSPGAHAQALDEVTTESENQGVVATIRLSGPVHYLRHFPEHRGKTLEIYYDRVQDATSTEIWEDGEVRNSPPSSLVPGFTVTTRDQQTLPKLVIEFAREAEFSVAAGKDRRSFLITFLTEKRSASNERLPLLPVIAPEAKTPAGAKPTQEEATIAKIRNEARALLIQARDALDAKNDENAVNLLNKLLLLPPNNYTQDAQEWIGVARERAGQFDKAKVEYELYLKLYPDSDGAARVAQRLAGLSGRGRGSATAPPTATVPTRARAATSVAFGSISSRYYHSNSKITATNTFNGTTATSSLSMVDQSMLITSVDASERYRTENYDSRLVFRDVDTRNYLANQKGKNLVYAGYGEIKGRTQNYLMRLGRQSSNGAGVLGRFDGMAASYGDAQQLRVNGVAGALSDYSLGSKPHFFGASVDKGAFSLYGINQTVEGVTDRRALGTELHYFDDKRNAYGLLDYDIYFKEVNAAELTGSIRSGGPQSSSTLSFLLDHRKTPSLSIRNALNGATTSSVSNLLQSMTESSLRDLALSRTSISNSGQIGITLPFRDKWQVGGDFRLTNTTGLPTSGTPTPTTGANNGIPTTEGFIQAVPGRGLERSVTGQLIGSGLYKQGDIWSGSLTASSSGSVKGNSLFFYSHIPVSSFWLMDATLQLSSSRDQLGGSVKQIMPLLRGSYRFKERYTFDADCGYQKIEFSGPQSSSSTRRLFFSTGLRWDF